MAGFVFVPRQAEKFSEEWRKLVGPYWPFHMVEFVSGQDKIKRERKFGSMTTQGKDAFLKKAIDLINRRIVVAISISCNVNDVRRLGPGIRGFRHAYSVCCYMCLELLAERLKRRGLDDRVAYFFECGHRFQSEASFLLGMAGRHPVLSEQARYESHAFVKKADSSALQAADLYAWELAKFMDETVIQRARKPRGSLKALVRPHPYRFEGRHLDEKKLYELTSMSFGR